MKTIVAIVILLSVCAGASAQKFGGGLRGYGGGTRVIVVPRVSYGVGLGFGYGYGGYNPYYGYNPYGYSPYGYRRAYGYGSSSKLALQIESIKEDYKQQIRDTRHDKSLSHSERRADIRHLKNEREQSIITAQENFVNRRANPNRRPPAYNNGNSGGTQNNDLIQ